METQEELKQRTRQDGKGEEEGDETKDAMKDAKGDEEEENLAIEDDRSAMELRRVRKATPKKRLLDEHLQSLASGPKAKRKKQEEDEIDDEMEEDEKGPESEKENDKIVVEVSESNMMTLQQFTDIVLASEGLEVEAKKAKGKPVILESYSRQNQIHHLGGTNKVKEENNNNGNTRDLAANLMQNNNDLIVEVKSASEAKAKPVVLSPRQPPGSHLLPHYAQRKAPLSNGVVVSVKPRLAKETTSSSSVNRVPPNKRPSSTKVPHHVEEWLNKLPAPDAAAAATKLKVEPGEALNLSTKQQQQQQQQHPVVSRTTQVYLRPIPTPPKLSAASTSSSCGQPRTARSLTNGSVALSPKELSPPGASSKPVTLVPKMQYSPSRSVDTNSTPPSLTPPIKRGVSPPRLEITRVAAAGSSPRAVGRAAPMDAAAVGSASLRLEAARARALRDVQVAHTKDMHGNLPIHMSVLMRKPELVRRYCCILQVLESPVDLLNEDKMTPLHLAVRDGSLEIAEILLSFGADPAARDRRGNSALHMAAAAGAARMVAAMAARLAASSTSPAAVAAGLNVANDYGLTPLHIATMNGDADVVQILAKSGADPGIPDSLQGLTPLAMAARGKLNASLFERFPKKSPLEIPSR